MKSITPLLLLLLTQLAATAQVSKAYYGAASCYIDLDRTQPLVYKMGYTIDKAGSGPVMIDTDTLQTLADGTLKGRFTTIIRENGEYYLLDGKKQKKRRLHLMKDANVANKQLNHGYCLGRYFDMAEHLNDKFKLNHHTFRGGFSTWETIAGKELPHAQFRLIMNERIKFIKDSVSMANERHIALTNYLKENLKIIDYTSLKEAIAKLPAAYAGSSKYYSIVLNEVAKQQPAYYFGLANDFPEQRGMIFWAVDRKKETMDGLRAVPGHEELKKQFFSKK